MSNASAAVLRKQLVEICAATPFEKPDIPEVVNIKHWFSEGVIIQLGQLRSAIMRIADATTMDFFLASFSSCVKRVSLADPRLSVPVRINPARAHRYGAKGDEVLKRYERLKTVDVLKVFWAVVVANLKRLEGTYFPSTQADMPIFEDARQINVADNTYDLIITSPPYAGAQKYIRASSLCLGWLGLTPGGRSRVYEEQSIGREHLRQTESNQLVPTGCEEADRRLEEIEMLNPSRARIAHRYMIEIACAIKEASRVLKPGGHMTLVVGPNSVASLEFNTPRYLRNLAVCSGLSVRLHLIDHIASRGLMTKRNKTAGLIDQESVFLLSKG
ncbi:MAG: hypothetical protein ACYDD1_00895 [Caulobacteraceae bacterium]